MIRTKKVKSIEELISSIKSDYSIWNTNSHPWFRGEPANSKKPLLPKLYRTNNNNQPHNENSLLQTFRMKAPSLGLMNTPPREHTDEWLFLAQHVGLPTRLLDWTESLFVALFFAVKEKRPALWMLDPVELNNKSLNTPVANNTHGLTWFNPLNVPVSKIELAGLLTLQNDPTIDYDEKLTILREQSRVHQGITNANIRGAWENDEPGTQLPVAIHPTYIHLRMHTQKSRFTVHGKIKESISDLVDTRVLKKYIIPANFVDSFRSDLRLFGFTKTSVFPDLDNLAMELSETY